MTSPDLLSRSIGRSPLLFSVPHPCYIPIPPPVCFLPGNKSGSPDHGAIVILPSLPSLALCNTIAADPLHQSLCGFLSIFGTLSPHSLCSPFLNPLYISSSTCYVSLNDRSLLCGVIDIPVLSPVAIAAPVASSSSPATATALRAAPS